MSEQEKWLNAIRRNELPVFAQQHFGWVGCSCDQEQDPGQDCRHASVEDKQETAYRQIDAILTRSGVDPTHLTIRGPWPHSWCDPDLFSRLKTASENSVLLFEFDGGAVYRVYWDDFRLLESVLGQAAVPRDALRIATHALIQSGHEVALCQPVPHELPTVGFYKATRP